MPRPPHARERVLDAFESILIDEGERAATLEATAKAAGVSKGGLLYHFASKDDLAAGLIARFRALVAEDIALLSAAPEGVIASYLRTSITSGDPLDRALIAITRLAQGGHAAATEALHTSRNAWAESIRPYVRDETSLDLILLLSDGLYFNNALDAEGVDTPLPTGKALDALIALAQRATT